MVIYPYKFCIKYRTLGHEVDLAVGSISQNGIINHFLQLHAPATQQMSMFPVSQKKLHYDGNV